MDSTFYVRTETKIFKFGKGSRCWIFLCQTLLLEKSTKPHALWKVLVSEVLDITPFLQGDAYLFQSLKRSFCNLDCFFFFNFVSVISEFIATVFLCWYNTHSLAIASVLSYPQMPTILLDNWLLGLELLHLASSPEITSFCLKRSQ